MTPIRRGDACVTRGYDWGLEFYGGEFGLWEFEKFIRRW